MPRPVCSRFRTSTRWASRYVEARVCSGGNASGLAVVAMVVVIGLAVSGGWYARECDALDAGRWARSQGDETVRRCKARVRWGEADAARGVLRTRARMRSRSGCVTARAVCGGLPLADGSLPVCLSVCGCGPVCSSLQFTRERSMALRGVGVSVGSAGVVAFASGHAGECAQGVRASAQVFVSVFVCVRACACVWNMCAGLARPCRGGARSVAVVTAPGRRLGSASSHRWRGRSCEFGRDCLRAVGVGARWARRDRHGLGVCAFAFAKRVNRAGAVVRSARGARVPRPGCGTIWTSCETRPQRRGRFRAPS